MRISFDLDDTLICNDENVPQESNKVPFFLRYWFNEPLRLGSCELMKKLEQYNHEIWIYTTSYRSVFYIRLWLFFYGIKITEIINQKIHLQYFGYSSPTKNPKAFNIDLHIDDSHGVKLEGDKYGFQVLVISPKDLNWTSKIMARLK